MRFFRLICQEAWQAGMGQAFTGDASVMLWAAFVAAARVIRKEKRNA
ncbi:hypothetical protein HY628_00375 [Candidatus Uhrbacteria bacterium]|nr:hypothetical protein [Candidatus Uhrbacteria bacterium]